VWQTKSGRPYDPVYFTHSLEAAVRRAGLPKLTPHQFRHYFISFLPQLDIHPTVAKSLARHASVSTTMNVYTSVEEGLKRQAMNKLATALAGRPGLRVVATDVPDGATDVRQAAP
jgi:integrase